MNWLNTNFPNWRSFSIGLVLAVAYAAHAYLLEGTVHKSTIVVTLAIAALGYVVKDKVVTGGSVAQTSEAERRAEPTGSNTTDGSKFPPIQTKGLGMMLFALLFSGAMVFTVAACGKRVEKIVNIPPGISEEQTQNWYKATGALSVVAENTKAATDLVIEMNHNGELPSGDSYQTALSVFGRISQGGIVMRNLLAGEPEHFTQSTRDQIVAFAVDALGQLAKLDTSAPLAARPCPQGATCAQSAASSGSAQKVLDQISGLKKALQELQAIPPPSHSETPTSQLTPFGVLRDTLGAMADVRRAEGLLLIGRI